MILRNVRSLCLLVLLVLLIALVPASVAVADEKSVGIPDGATVEEAPPTTDAELQSIFEAAPRSEAKAGEGKDDLGASRFHQCSNPCFTSEECTEWCNSPAICNRPPGSHRWGWCIVQ